MSQTSASAPHVSGLAGLILSLNPNLSEYYDVFFTDVRDIIRNTAEKVDSDDHPYDSNGYNDYLGYGRINAYEALKYTLRHYGGTLKGEVVLHKALILESGVTLTILPGTTIKTDGYYNIIAKAGATIQAIGTEENPITFTSFNGTSPSSWKNVFLYGGGSRFEHCIFKYGNWAVVINGYPSTSGQNIFSNCSFYDNDQALRIQNNNSTIVENCKIYDNRHGIVTYSVSDLDFTGNHVHNNNRDGLYSIGNSDLSFVYNVIDYNGEGHYSTCNGIYSRSSDHITLYNPNSSKNTIRNNYSKEIYASYGSPIIDLGNPVHGGNNAVFDSLHTNDAEIYNRSGNPAISAQHCYWGQNGAQTQGSVDTSYPITTRPSWVGSTTGGIGKSAAPVPDDIHKRIADLKLIINSKSRSNDAIYALAELYGILRGDIVKNSLGEKEAFYPYLQSLYEKYKNSPLGQMALEKMIMWQTVINNNKEAVELSETALKLFSKQDRARILENLVILYLRFDDTEKAEELLKTLKSESKDNPQIEFLEEEICSVKEQIQEGVRGASLEKSPELLKETSSADDKGSENPMQIYPNPGNPDITISFKVKEEAGVELKVINLLGREVRTIVEEKKAPGTYTVKWDGKTNLNSPAPSGIYICRLRIGTKVYTQKASLVK